MVHQPERPALSPFDLNLRSLRGLATVCELGSISAAAAHLGLSQPALTQRIVKLEVALGLPLFERHAQGMRPTEAGLALRDRAQAALGLLSAGAKLVAGPAFEVDRRVTAVQLQPFLALFASGSFAQAAGSVGLSEAATQRAIRGLEAALGKALVERRGRSLGLNAMGRRFARSCRLAHNEIRAAFADLDLGFEKPTITVGTTPLARAFLVPEAMALLGTERAGAGFQVFEGSWGELVETLREGLIDIIVGEVPAYQSPDIVKIPLYDERVVIVAGREHPLAGVRQPTLAQLSSHPWTIAPENSPLRAEWERMFEDARPSAPIECGSIMIIGRLLTSSRLLTLATPDQVALQIRSGLLARVGEPLPSRHTIGVTMRLGWRPPPAQKRFLQLLDEVARPGGESTSRSRQVKPEWN